jgi:archaemetzincin
VPGFDPALAVDASRGQYNSRVLLGQLLRDLRPVSTRVLGVTGVDLFIPVLTYVFGEAQLGAGGGGVDALAGHRARRPGSSAAVPAAAAQEAVHELGHVRLVHRPPAAASWEPTYVEEIDQVERFCDRRLSEVRRAARRPPISV